MHRPKTEVKGARKNLSSGILILHYDAPFARNSVFLTKCSEQL